MHSFGDGGDWKKARIWVAGEGEEIFFFPKLGMGSLLHFLPFSRDLRDQIPLLLCFQQSFIISLTSEKEKIKNTPSRRRSEAHKRLLVK